MLIISMLIGIGLYLGYHFIPSVNLHSMGPMFERFIRFIQPVLLFSMLFLSFCKIEPKAMKPHKWQAWLLLVQGGLFVLLCGLLIWAAQNQNSFADFLFRNRISIESALLCLICPTATACAVVTGKLGGDMAGVVSYTILINLLVAILVPLLLPLIYPIEGMNFHIAFIKILSKVFPLLIMPCICAWIIRFFMPHVQKFLLKHIGLSFYIWAISLCLAILMSTRAVINSGNAIEVLLKIACVSLICCAFQFWAGKRIGDHYNAKITAGQALGQKNTVFAIWIAYTFMDPVVSVVGGFYSIWHNCYNSYQLKKTYDRKYKTQR